MGVYIVYFAPGSEQYLANVSHSECAEVDVNLSPLLSICVPTYNRATFLQEALEAILEQVDALPTLQTVEVVVVNNASTDSTLDVLEQIRQRYPKVSLHVHTRPENIGADNVYLCTEFAVGEYVMLVSDDDLMMPRTLEEFFEIIGTHPNVDAVLFNLCSFDKSVEETSTPLFEWSEGILNNKDEVLGGLGAMISYMSALTYRRSLIAQQDYSFARHKNLIQAYAYVDVLNKGLFFYRSKHVAYAYRNDNTVSWNLFKVFITHFGQLMHYAKNIGFLENTVKKCKYWMLRNITNTIARVKAKGSFGELEIDYQYGGSRLLANYYSHWFFWLVTLPVFLFPKWYAILFKTLQELPREHFIKQGLRKVLGKL